MCALGNVHVHFTGTVEDVLPFIERSDGMIVPLLRCPRLKILEMRKAVVSTSVVRFAWERVAETLLSAYAETVSCGGRVPPGS